MTQSYLRRRVLAAVVPLGLSGCLVESDTNQSNDSVHPTTSTTTTDADASASSSSDTQPGGQPNEEEIDDTPNEGVISPDPAGIEIESFDIDRIIESIYLSQIVAEVVIANPGTDTYGTLELRADAYYEPPADDRTYHPPRVDERTAVGRTYIERTFESFDSGTRTIEDIIIQYDTDDTNGSTDPTEFDIEIAVRRADPL
ncbi:hypothetical protein [Halorubrum persicum]|uniref:hypothetical protein n=1 Tax=Halorubrum persicum TaxID=1383844 RepID=UPI00118187CE|nr:hypothetical protein [Halorubrum persicum]